LAVLKVQPICLNILMITVNFHKSFLKSYGKRIKNNQKLKLQAIDRVELFKTDKSNSLLKDHPLTGKKQGLRAFSITGDVRIVYHFVSDDFVEFLDIGSHNQVY